MSRPGDLFRTCVRDTGFLEKYPLYAGILAQATIVASDRIPVMGVRWRDARYELLVNEGFFARRKRFLRGVLLHECHHIVLGHLARREFFDVARPDLMQLAMEVSANEYVTEPLPEPIVWTQFRHLGIDQHQSTQQRYELLAAAPHLVDPLLQRAVKTFDDHGDDGQEGDGHGVGIADVVKGRALPASALARTQALLVHARGTVAERAVPRLRLDAGARLDALHALLRDLRSRPVPMFHGLLGRNIDAAILELTPAAGSARIDWRSALRAFVGHSPRSTWARPNRRRPERMLEVPGRTWHGGRPEVLVAIDTSASMEQAELAAIARELRTVATHAQLTIAECDDAVRRIRPFSGTLDDVAGRGGTDLRPPFAPELLRRYGRDGVVYFTDGDGPVPDAAPGVPVLWVLTCLPEQFECGFGRRVRLTVETDADAAAAWDIPF